MKNLLLIMTLTLSSTVFSTEVREEAALEIDNMNYGRGDYGLESSPFILSGVSYLSPISGIISSSLVHCNALAMKVMNRRMYREESENNESSVVLHFEYISACMVRTPLLPFDVTENLIEDGIFRASTDETKATSIGFLYGLDGDAELLGEVQIEGISQLSAVASGLEELPIAKVLIDEYIKTNEEALTRAEIAELILEEIQ